MGRFVEYICIIGTEKRDFFDDSPDNTEFSSTVLHRLPADGRVDYPCPEAVELFAFPSGITVSRKSKGPKFFSNVLTSVSGESSYLAILSFDEMLTDEDTKDAIYVSKAICIISRHAFFHYFRLALVDIYKSFFPSVSNKNINKIIINLLNTPANISCGSRPFSLTVSEDLTINVCPPLSFTVPATDESVYLLAKHLGIVKLVKLFKAALLDNKILFISSSRDCLRKAAAGLSALIYPFIYIYVFIPDLPSKLLHVLHAPTPFIIGIHSSITNQIESYDDIIMVNLDVGSIQIPDNIVLPSLPENLDKSVLKELSKCLFPAVHSNDSIFYTKISSDSTIIDKKIRSVFLFLMAMILHGFSSSIIYLRVHPVCIVKFEEKLFHEVMNSRQDGFINRLAKSSLFNQFVTTRGVAFRRKDIFDDVLTRKNIMGKKFNKKLLSYITNLLLTNEYKKVISERVTGDLCIVESIYGGSNISTSELDTKLINKNVRDCIPELVIKPSKHPMAANEDTFINFQDVKNPTMHGFSIPRVDYAIVTQTLDLLFEGKISIVRQVLPKLEKLMVNQACVYLICIELKQHSRKDRLNLSYEQFMIVSKILRACFKLTQSRKSTVVICLVINLSCKFFTTVNGHRRLYIAAVMNFLCRLMDLSYWVKLCSECVAYKLCKMYSKGKFVLPNEYNNLFKTVLVTAESENVSTDKATDQLSIVHPFYLMPLISPVLVGNEIALSRKLTEENVTCRISNECEAVTSKVDKYILKIIKCSFDIEAFLKIKQTLVSVNNNCLNVKNLLEAESVKNFIGCLKDKINGFIDSMSSAVEIKYESILPMRVRSNESLITYLKTIDDCFLPFFSSTSQFGNNLLVSSVNLLAGENILLRIEAFILPNGIRHSFNYEENSNNLFPAYGTIFLTNYKFSFVGYSLNGYMSEIPVTINLPHGLITALKQLSHNFVPDIYSAVVSIQYSMLIKCNVGSSYVIGIPDSLFADKVDDFTKVVRMRFDALTKFIYNRTNLNEEINDNDSVIFDISDSTNEKVDASTLASRKFTIKSRLPSFGSFATLSKERRFDIGNFQSRRSRKSDEISDILDSSTTPFYMLDYERLGIPRYLKSTKNDVFHVMKIPFCIREFWKTEALFGSLNILKGGDLSKLSRYFKHKRFPVLSWIRTKTDKNNATNKVAILRSSEVSKSLSGGQFAKSSVISKISGSTGDLDILFNSLFHSYCVCNPSSEPTKKENRCSTATHNSRLFRLMPEATEQHDIFEEDYCFKKLYWFGNKPTLKNVSSEDSFSLLNFEYVDASQIKQAYNKLLKVNSAVKNVNKTYNEIMSKVSQSNWLKYITNLVEISSVITFLTNIGNSFCQIAYGDGTEEASQITSLCQVMSDSYYRTCKGFLVLIDKEWIAYKHRFIHRNGVINSNQNTFTPYFIQFLDCVHQLLLQYPCAFEYNDFFLKFIAYHSVSNRFLNFLVGYFYELQNNDNQCTGEPVSHEIASDKVSQNDTGSDNNSKNMNDLYSDSFFNFVLKIAENSTLFYNSQYIPDFNIVLYPSFHISSVEIWDFYFTDESLQTETFEIYNIDNIYKDFRKESHSKLSVAKSYTLDREVIQIIDKSRFYDYQLRRSTRNDPITKLLDDFLDKGVDYVTLADKIKVYALPPSVQSAALNFVNEEGYKYGNTEIGSIHKCYMIKLSFMKIVSKNKNMKVTPQKIPYHFVYHSMNDYTVLVDVNCGHCRKIIMPKTSCLRCKHCGIILHPKCAKNVSSYCNFYGEEYNIYYLKDSLDGNSNVDVVKRSGLHQKKVVKERKSSLIKKGGFATNLSSRMLNNSGVLTGEVSYSGYLCRKTGVQTKKRRFFILDYFNNKLYKFKNDSSVMITPKSNFIDLKGLISCEICVASSASSGTLKKGSNVEINLCTFELKFKQRSTKTFVAPSIEETCKWVDSLKKILNC